jgi:hypothetical protein
MNEISNTDGNIQSTAPFECIPYVQEPRLCLSYDDKYKDQLHYMIAHCTKWHARRRVNHNVVPHLVRYDKVTNTIVLHSHIDDEEGTEIIATINTYFSLIPPRSEWTSISTKLRWCYGTDTTPTHRHLCPYGEVLIEQP